MPRKPIVHKRQRLNDTGIFKIEAMDLEFSNGQTRQYQRIVGSEAGAVLIVPMLDDATLLLIREYAAGMDRYELAFPKGRIDAGEERLSAANRELREETGYAANNLELLRSLTVAPGYIYHTTHLILATDLYRSPLQGDEPEPLEVVPWRLSDLDRLWQQPEFSEARSQVALYMIRDRFC